VFKLFSGMMISAIIEPYVVLSCRADREMQLAYIADA
jgi:hypothetical protein